MEKKFVHLRLHTEYSLSDGILVIPNVFEQAATYRMPALAITDLGNLYATVKFYQAAHEYGIKPIIGVDVRLFDEKTPQDYSFLTLLCQNNIGYQNLLRLVSRSFLEGQTYGLPALKKSW